VVEVARSFGGRYARRDRALFMVGIYTGFRITELLSLCWRDCVKRGEVTESITIERRHMKKKRRGRTVALHPKAREALRDWHAQDQPASGSLFVFRSRKGHNQPLSRQTAWYF
jgi:integrase/recombinase XerD